MKQPRPLPDTLRPIIQAPMAGSQGSALALAVCSAGGLGSLAAATLSPDRLAAELRAMASGTGGPWNLNLFCHRPPAPDPDADAGWLALLRPYYDELGIPVPGPARPGAGRVPFNQQVADIIEPFRPPVMSFHFGLPEPSLLARVKSWGSTVLSSATTLAEARWLEAHGADAIIAQGVEAGGHRGMFLDPDPVAAVTTQVGTLSLVPQVAAAVRVPVVAAGGIAGPEAVRAALALGASAVQVGTSYLLCPETTVGPVHRAALASPDACHTALTNLFSGRPARSMVNRLMRDLGALNNKVPAFPGAVAALAPLRVAAEAAGSSDFTSLWAGQNTSGCSTMPAADLTRHLASGL